MIRAVKTNLRDVPVAADRVKRRVSVFGVAPVASVTDPEVRDEVRALALDLLGTEPTTESLAVVVQPGEAADFDGVARCEVEIGDLFELEGVPFRVRDAPLAGEGMVVVSLSAEITVPDIFELES